MLKYFKLIFKPFLWTGESQAKYTFNKIFFCAWRHIQNSNLNKKAEKENGFYKVFGHTVVSEPVIEKNIAMIDTGACFKDGKLTALCYPTLEIVHV